VEAETCGVDIQAHWVDRDADGRPGHVTLNDVPATSKAYDTVEKARCGSRGRRKDPVHRPPSTKGGAPEMFAPKQYPPDRLVWRGGALPLS
jgi:hypothetical protein